ncbi:hypothetical protein [Dyella sp.]|uniref:hypothetical protein n=1 Tax=Dyella sp. TaxID=1869338 RepID=UPI002ED373BC
MDFSISRALGSGFSLLARRPLAPFAWSLAFVLVSVVPMALMFAYVFSDMSAFFAGMQHMDPQAGIPPEMLRLQSKMMMFNPVMFVTGLAGRALVVGAVYRSVLEPGDRRFFSLRVGMRELWLALALFLYSVMVALAMFGVLLGGAALGGLAWLITSFVPGSAAQLVLRIVLLGAVGVAAFVAWIWVAIRLSLGPVMSFAASEFRFFESWNLTRGHALRLTGLYVVLSLIAFVIALILELVVVAILYARLGGFDRAHLQAFLPTGQVPDILPVLSAMVPAFVLIFALIGPLCAIFMAPMATVYRDLKGSAALEYRLGAH